MQALSLHTQTYIRVYIFMEPGRAGELCIFPLGENQEYGLEEKFDFKLERIYMHVDRSNLHAAMAGWSAIESAALR